MSFPPPRPVDSASEERRRRESDARNSAILATALDAIITMDHEGNTVEFNPAAERIFGYRRDAIIGQNLADFIIPEALRERHRRVSRAISPPVKVSCSVSVSS